MNNSLKMQSFEKKYQVDMIHIVLTASRNPKLTANIDPLSDPLQDGK